MADIANAAQQLQLQAKELGLKEEAARYTNALNKAKKYESYAKTANTWVKTADEAWRFVNTLIDDIDKSIHR
jgi:hypothetical protein